MSCSHPLRAYPAKRLNPTGKRSIVFNKNLGFADLPLDLPCGQCIHCRLEKSRQRAIQCLHEASLYPKNAFLTLTYNNQNLPLHGTLIKNHFQKFMKRYRKWLNSHKISYYMCGEYGDLSQRPHYHALIFNHDFSDKIPYQKNKKTGDQYFMSPKLNELWTHGNCLIGAVTFESAAYVARYVTKKLTGKKALLHYGEIINKETGEITPRRIPEYAHPSHGLGKKWLGKFMDDTYPSDSIALRGKLVKPPKYYDRLFEKAHPQEFAELKRARIALAKESAKHNTWERRLASEKIKLQQISNLKRTI